MNLDFDFDELAELLEGSRVATAESVTAGALAQALAAAPGASQWFCGGIVAYTREAKQALLEVPPGPVVTQQAAEAMAAGAAERFRATVSVATTGVAGPSSLDGAVPGTVMIAWTVDGKTDSGRFYFDGDPEMIVDKACHAALIGLVDRLLVLRRAGAGTA